MGLSVTRSVGAAALCSIMVMAGPVAANAADRDIIAQARGTYYNLTSQGLVDFQCHIVPDWSALLKELMASDPDQARKAIALLSQIQFTVTVGVGKDTIVEHTTVAAENDQVATGLAQVYSGMEQMVTGFFQTWSMFMITSSLPDPDSRYTLQKVGGQWALTYKDGSDTDVTTMMGEDLSVRDLHVVTPQFNSNIQPQFTGSNAGRLLTAYQATYLGQTPDETTVLQVRMDYQPINGLSLPKSLNLSGSYGASAFAIAVAFTDCSAAKR